MALVKMSAASPSLVRAPVPPMTPENVSSFTTLVSIVPPPVPRVTALSIVPPPPTSNSAPLVKTMAPVPILVSSRMESAPPLILVAPV